MSPRAEHPHETTTNQYKTSLSLGHILKKRRQELKLSLEQVEKATKIRRQYLEFIESGNYDRLQDNIYSRGYVKNYADYLGLETAPILLLYRKERGARAQSLKLRDSHRQKIGLTPIDSPRWVITPRTFAVLSVIALLGLILGYIIWQFTGLAAAPKLTLDNPGEETVTSNVAFVSGRVNEGAEVSINDSPILTNSDGAFREQIALVNGPNQIRVSAHNKLGKTATVTKTYIANLPSTNSPAPTQTQPQQFGGVQLDVHVRGGTSWIIVSADDKEIYRGTMLDGSSQTFQAADHLDLSVGNAGVVDVHLTNNQVVNKDLGVVGKPGVIRRDLIFNKDTNALAL